ncbi:MAG: hypothetical protein M1821_004824 [Bathelium mastoideum]|nr:MAG: hypothetical protein M1821_004824 [Bathelium mastoideum]KAI9692235.1 MAG: hypothetical protein M1822_006465 [Bathelium mastoideum]
MSNAVGDKRGDVLGACITTTAVALIALALRFWSRAVAKKVRFWWDDWAALASAPFLVTLCALSIWFVSLGFGLHVEEALHHGSPHRWDLILWIVNLVYNTGLSCVKLSVVLFYFRVFRQIGLYRYAFWTAAFLVVAWCIGNNFLSIFVCFPVQSYWTGTPHRYCITNGDGFLEATISNVIIDFIILLLPMPICWRLHLTTKRKIALVGAFICGYCTAVVSIVRLVIMIQLGDSMHEDLTWNYVQAQILVSIEMPIALFSSSLPAIFYLAKRMLEKRRLGRSKSSNQLSYDSRAKWSAGTNTTEDGIHLNFTRLPSHGTNGE